MSDRPETPRGPNTEGPSRAQLPLRLWDAGAPRLETFADAVAPEAAAFVAVPPGDWPAPGAYLWGDTGLGKTHLMLAVCHALHQKHAPVAYIDLAGPTAPAALENLEHHALVCLDHLDAVRGQSEWLRALFGLCERSAVSGCRLLFAAHAPPARIDTGLADLDSRLARLTVFKLNPLSDTQLAKAMVQRAQALGFDLPESSVRFLLDRLPRTMPAVCAALDSLNVHTLAQHRRATVPAIKDALGL